MMTPRNIMLTNPEVKMLIPVDEIVFSEEHRERSYNMEIREMEVYRVLVVAKNIITRQSLR